MNANQSKRQPGEVLAVLDLRSAPEAWLAMTCGLSVAVRALLTLQHAGFQRAFLVGEAAQEALRQVESHPYHALEIQIAGEIPPGSDAPRLLFRHPVIFTSSAVQRLADQATTAGFDVPLNPDEESDNYLVPAQTAAERRRAAHRLRQSCRKPVEFSGIWSALFQQSISLLMARVVCRLPVTPNAVTILAFLVGLVALPLYIEGSHLAVAIAGGVLVFNALLDMLDGQIARLKFRFSNFGEQLDQLGDSTLNTLLLAPVGIGLHHTTGQIAWEIIGWAGSIGSALYLLIIRYYLWKKGHSGYTTGMQFWYWLDKQGRPKASKVAKAAPPKSGIRRYLVSKYFLRKDFTFTMFLVFGLFNLHFVPLCLMAFGRIHYGMVALIQFTFFHNRIRFVGSHRGNI